MAGGRGAANRQKQHGDFDDNEYEEKYRPRAKRQRAGRGTAYGRWCDDVEKLIIEKLAVEEHTESFFMHPVSKKDVPNYHKVIEKPICLRQIRDNLRRHGYAEKNQFLADVYLMFDNCRRFNRGTASNWLADIADKLQQTFDRLMEQNSEHLNALEQRVDQEHSAPLPSTAWQNAPGLSPNASVSSGSPTFSPGTSSFSGSPTYSPLAASPASGPMSPASSYGSPASATLSPMVGDDHAGGAVFSSSEEES